MGNVNSSMFQQFQTSVVILNQRHEIIFANQAFLEESGFTDEEMTGKNANEILTCLDPSFENAKGEVFIKTKSGVQTPKWMEMNGFETEGEEKMISLILSDLEKSGVDPLTMLPNRYFFYKY